MIPVTVGIIANPASGKDIRRLVAHGTVFDNQEKTSIVRRLVLACLHSGVDRVLYMPDYHGLVEKAVSGLGSDYKRQTLAAFADGTYFQTGDCCPVRRLCFGRDCLSCRGPAEERLQKGTVFLRPGAGLPMLVEPVDITLTATQEDSREAAEKMAAAGTGCIVVLGGDGTSRQAAKGASEVPLLPISTGTNNVFPTMVEATTAGLAASAVASGRAGGGAVYRAKRILILKNGRPVDLALVDAVVTRSDFIGSRAMWEVDRMVAAAFTRGEPDNIGLASIIGKSSPVGPHDPFGAWVVFRPGGRDVFAPIAPGLFKPVGLAEVSRLALGEEKEVTIKPLTEGGSASADQAAHLVIALDGEREVDLSDGDQISIRLDDQGPLVVDVKAALAGAVAAGFFTDRKFMNQFND